MENYGAITRGGDEGTPLPLLVFVALPFTRSLPAIIQWLARRKLLRLFFFGLHVANLLNFF